MTDYKNPKLIIETSEVEEGSITWRSPSNIAIIKYWGKYGIQIPRNPSISFTLDKAYTETQLYYKPKKGVDTGIALSFLFDGEPNEAFENRLIKYLETLVPIFPFLRQLELTIQSKNSFPHSTGIASSASSMSALALCLCSLEDELFSTLNDDISFRQKASFIARLGSGSACRSIYPQMALWGETGEVKESSNDYAIPFIENLHPVFSTFHDDILIVSQGKKKVSSSAGHALMENNLYAENRYQQARQRLHTLLLALKNGDLERFGQITESEALTLHALMMTSNPPYVLMEPNTLEIIKRVQLFRESTGEPLYFTLDAGPNIHLLYPDNIRTKVQAFIESELVTFCENRQVIEDITGKGPLQL